MKARPDKAKPVYDAIKQSDIFDKKLKSYKSCVSLENETFEIGRIKAWGRGWIENESVYTHMLFKYLLEIINAELYEDFYKDIPNIIMPFLDPEIYGRSIFENVSFIVSSAFIDEKKHGQGLQARLSGSTCEMIHIWTLMCIGKQPFKLNNDKLVFKLEPKLSDWLFTDKPRTVKLFHNEQITGKLDLKENSFMFKLFSKIPMVYINPEKKNTFGENKVSVKSYILYYNDKQEKIESDFVAGKFAEDIRNCKVNKIEVELG
jgi:hypothetical protein